MTSSLPQYSEDVSRETMERLSVFAALVRKWNQKINLVSPATLSELEDRHLRDSMQLYHLIPDWSETLADFGSGGGFPGMVLAIMGAQAPNPREVTLVESDTRKATFLRTVLRETGVSAQVLAKRIENLPPLQTDVVTARALAPLPSLLAWCKPHLADRGVCLFQKGRTWKKEVEDARRQWNFDPTVHKSKTDPEAVILDIQTYTHA